MKQEYNIGYNVELTAYNYGNPQTSSFGNAIRRGWNPYSGVDYGRFPYEPYMDYQDFFGYQLATVPPSEYLFADTFGYRGILPIGLQRVSPEPYPYETGYPYNESA